MSQSDIYELLKTKRLSGDNKYFSIEDIRKELAVLDKPNKRQNVNDAVAKLRIFGYLELKIESNKKSIRNTYVSYRLKKEYL